jgi:hypothetical protein
MKNEKTRNLEHTSNFVTVTNTEPLLIPVGIIEITSSLKVRRERNQKRTSKPNQQYKPNKNN